MARKEALSKLRQVLIGRREALRAALMGDLSLLNELKNEAYSDVFDAALDNANDEISSQLVEVETRELSQIDQALDRMKSGNYGVCEACEKAIPLSRLQALPFVTMCIECQRESEKRSGSQWGYGRSESRVSLD
ncbi:MAG: ral stress protein [Planctomycetota bacterium]|jgi:DnaK suppressor protein